MIHPPHLEPIEDIERKYRKEVHELAEFTAILDRAMSAPPLHSLWMAPSTDTITSSLQQGALRARLECGLAAVRLDTYFREHFNVLRLYRPGQSLVQPAEDLLPIIRNPEDLKPWHSMSDGELRQYLLECCNARQENFPFFDPHWQIQIPDEIPHLPPIEQKEHLTRARNFCSDLIGAYLCAIKDQKLAQAIEFVESQKSKVTKAELAEHMGLSLDAPTFRSLWDMLRICTTNLQTRGRPRKSK